MGAKRVDAAERLSDRLLYREARQPIGDVEPRSLEVDEDVTLRPNSGIVVECSCRDADHASVIVGTGPPHTPQNVRRYPGGLTRTGAS